MNAQNFGLNVSFIPILIICTQAPSTRIRFCLKTEILFRFWPTVHTFGENGHGRCIFCETLSRLEIFENVVCLYFCGWIKTEVFENVTLFGDSKCALLPSKMVPFSVTFAFSCGLVKGLKKRNVWTRIFFQNGVKKKLLLKQKWKRGLYTHRGDEVCVTYMY